MLISCGPSPSELRVRDELRVRNVIENSLKMTIYQLPLPIQISDDYYARLYLAGSYYGRNGRAVMEYHTAEKPREICYRFRNVLRGKLDYIKPNSQRAECIGRKIRNKNYYSIDGQNLDSSRSIDIGITEDTFDGKPANKIEILIREIPDRERWEECVPNGAGITKKICDRVWSVLLELPEFGIKNNML